MARTKNVISGVLLLFPKTRVELSGSQNEAAIQLLAKLLPLFLKYLCLSLCTSRRELARTCLGCHTVQGLYFAPAPKDLKEV